MPGRRSLALLALLVLAACERALPAPPSPPEVRPRPSAVRPAAMSSPVASVIVPPSVYLPPLELPPRRRFAGGGPASVSGRRGVVTSSEAHATHAGVAVLERGGNAVDAAVATA